MKRRCVNKRWEIQNQQKMKSHNCFILRIICPRSTASYNWCFITQYFRIANQYKIENLFLFRKINRSRLPTFDKICWVDLVDIDWKCWKSFIRRESEWHHMRSVASISRQGWALKHDDNLVLAEIMMNHGTLWLLDETDGEHYNHGIATTKHGALSVSS